MYADDISTPQEYIQIIEEETKKNRERYYREIKSKNPDAVFYSSNGLKKGIPVMFEASITIEDLQADVDVLIRSRKTSSKRRHNYIPTLIIGTQKIAKDQKLKLAAIGFIFSKFQKEKPALGIIVGSGNTTHKIKLETLYKEVGQILKKLKFWVSDQELESPPIILNKHCPYCSFQNKCEAEAKEQDHLSLLGGIRKKEIEKYNQRGIFTVNQLSYTFHPSKMKNKKENYVKPHSFPLQALAIREQRIYVHETPKLPTSKVEIYFDIEGIPDEEFQYLIGLLVKENNQVKHHFFWSNCKDEELTTFRNFLSLLDQYDAFTLFHYGTYETNYLKKMNKNISKNEQEKMGRILRSCCNILSFLYSNIYFPTYTNGLKDIGKAIGFSWSDANASGLQSIVWRKTWEHTHSNEIKNKLIKYNEEDCRALLKIKSLIDSIINNENTGSDTPSHFEIVYPNDSECSSNFAFMRNDFALPEMELINNCSYFDYQRERVYVRMENGRKQYHKKKVKSKGIRNRINKTIKIISLVCPKCGNSKLKKLKELNKRVANLKFSNSGAKKWITKYVSYKYFCNKCDYSYIPQEYPTHKQNFGHNIKCWTIFQHIFNRESFKQIEFNLLELFSIKLAGPSIHAYKEYIAKYYKTTYDRLLRKILNSHVVYVDETPFNLLHETVYAWVFTNGFEVVSLYKPTREGGFLKELLQDFKGVIVSDFFVAYDLIDCPQQKCLIHLMRDFNTDLLDNPFDNELKDITRQFTSLLQGIVKTIDKYGLKRRYLNKHNKEVKTFFKNTLKKEYQSEVAQQYQQRLKKNENKLFTFLNYDNIGWNNTNAEHAIKLLATHRNKNTKFLRSSRMESYLKIMSIYQTCEYREISFLQFMLSKEVDFDKFIQKHLGKNKGSYNQKSQ